jgi:BASS family bile acid:Na+ symporter
MSTAALLIGISAGLFVSWQDIIGAIGSWIFPGTAVLLAIALLAGYVVGYGRSRSTSDVTMLGTGQRNISAALVVAGSLSGDVVVLTMVAGLVIIIVLLTIAGEIGRRRAGAAQEPAA